MINKLNHIDYLELSAPTLYKDNMSNFKQFLIFSKALESSKIKIIKFFYFDFSGELFDILLKCLSYNDSIDSIFLVSCKIEDKGLINFSENLHKFKRIKSINLNGNFFASLGINLLLKNLLKTEIIEYLNLSYILCDEQILKNVSEFLSKSKSLREFSFNNNGIRNRDLEILLQGLNENSILKIIHLQENDLDFRAIKILSDRLNTNTTIEIINIAANDIDNRSIIYLKDFLDVNRTIKTIDISFTNITIYEFDNLRDELRKRLRYVETYMEQ